MAAVKGVVRDETDVIREFHPDQIGTAGKRPLLDPGQALWQNQLLDGQAGKGLLFDDLRVPRQGKQRRAGGEPGDGQGEKERQNCEEKDPIAHSDAPLG